MSRRMKCIMMMWVFMLVWVGPVIAQDETTLVTQNNLINLLATLVTVAFAILGILAGLGIIQIAITSRQLADINRGIDLGERVVELIPGELDNQLLGDLSRKVAGILGPRYQVTVKDGDIDIVEVSSGGAVG